MTAATHDDATLLLDHPIGRRGRLAIRLASAEIRLVADDTDRVTIRVPGGRSLPDRVILETTDGGATIREQETHGISFGIGRGTVQVEVTAPAESEVVVDTASGWIEARGFRGQQHYRTASGDVRLREIAGLVELNAVSGDAAIELAGAAELGLRTVSGDVAVEGGRVTRLKIQTTSGDVRVDSPLGGTGHTIETLSGDVSLVAARGMRVEARTVSGDLSSDLPHRTEGRMGRRTLIVGDGATELAFRSVSGDLRIHDGLHADGAKRGNDQMSAGQPVTGFEDRTAIPPLPAMPMMPAMPQLPAMPSTPPLPPLSVRSPGASTASHVGKPDDRPAAEGESASEPAGAPAQPGSTAEAERLTILRALEAGEIDVAAAMDRLATLDGDEDDADA
jgi:putative adhesin